MSITKLLTPDPATRIKLIINTRQLLTGQTDKRIREHLRFIETLQRRDVTKERHIILTDMLTVARQFLNEREGI